MYALQQWDAMFDVANCADSLILHFNMAIIDKRKYENHRSDRSDRTQRRGILKKVYQFF